MSEVETCPECDRVVNRDINGKTCPYCHAETFAEDPTA